MLRRRAPVPALCYGIVYADRTRLTARQVRLNEISGLSVEDLDDALGGRRVFWTGPHFDFTWKRKVRQNSP